MRLIDGTALLIEIGKNDLEYMQQSDLMECIKDTINNQPTIFDLESVITKIVKLKEQSEKDKNYYYDNCSSYPCEYNKADLKEVEHKTFLTVLEILNSACSEEIMEFGNNRNIVNREEMQKELYFANAIIGAIKNVKTPMLMYQEEKDVVEKALRMYIDNSLQKSEISQECHDLS